MFKLIITIILAIISVSILAYYTSNVLKAIFNAIYWIANAVGKIVVFIYNKKIIILGFILSLVVLYVVAHLTGEW
ncbi:hypothetical protein [Lachnospira multipara]|uniref:Uncharacterized protein n=1 Tax=Lachnospira multipara TaxID=28051 RepID=A0A1H5WXW6_9FIRM|nr:hypothetical protein [Lachnospira multipara]SEG04000.1 hypothetical protein SAMN05216537_11928 [Lachnospira multipara]